MLKLEGIKTESNSKAGAVEKSAALAFFDARKPSAIMEGGESYGIISGKERQTTGYLYPYAEVLVYIETDADTYERLLKRYLTLIS